VKEKKIVNGGLRVGHDRETVGTGCANFLEFAGLAWQGQARPCHHRYGPCQGSGILRLNFFSFSSIVLGQLPTKQLKTTKNKQNKSD